MEPVPPLAIPLSTPRPLIVTMQLDPAAQDRFDRERLEHFPAGRTVIGAHVTLFHAVLATAEPAVREELVASSTRPPFELAVCELMSLGRGSPIGCARPSWWRCIGGCSCDGGRT